MEFSEILKDLLIELNINQNEFAKKLGLKSGQISDWKSGRSKPGYDSLKLICQTFGISSDRLLGLRD